ncbi:MAG: outer membrane lipoprotein-sorting protein [Spirochaetota bacterium]
MKNKITKSIITTLLMIMSFVVFGFSQTNNLSTQDVPIDIDEVLSEMDTILNFGREGSISANVSMIHKDTDGEKKARTALIYRKDKWDKMMIIFTSPLSMVGSGYLSIDRNLWYYDASSGEWIRKTKKEKYADTDVETKDLEKNKYKPFYNWEYVGEGSVGEVDCYIIEGTAKFEDMPYPKEKVWIRKDNYLPVKEESYTVSDVLSRTAYMLHYTKLYDKKADRYTYIDDKRLIIDNIDKTQSIREFTNISIRDLPDSMFSKAYFVSKSGN